MVWQFIDVFKKVSLSARIQDDDFSDRLNHRWTVALLLLFSILVGSSQFVGSPIACWVPAHFTGAMTTYANYICWISDKYYVPTSDYLTNKTHQTVINYYQWVPFILVFMALLFYAPFSLWHLWSRPAGLDAKSLMKIVSQAESASTETREKAIDSGVKLIDRVFYYSRDYDMSRFGRFRRRLTRCLLPTFRSGNYISTLYLVIKILYIINVITQFLLLSLFMGQNFLSFGIRVIQDIFTGNSFWESPRFPRVTMCNFTIRTLGENNHNHVVECTLPINLFNEKIFIFIWFWLFFVVLTSLYTLITWTVSYFYISRVSFIKRYLKVNSRLCKEHHSSASSLAVDAKTFDAFIFDYLRLDGVFLLRLVKKNTNDMVVGDFVCALWDNFKRSSKYEIQSPNFEAQSP